MDFFYSIVTFFSTGGVFMYPILIVFAVALAIASERYITLAVSTKKNQGFWVQVQPVLSEGDFEACLARAAGDARPAITVVRGDSIDAIDAADVVICLGYDMVEYHPKLWNPNNDKKIVHIDFLPAEVDAHYPVACEVVGDLAHTLWMLRERLGTEGSDQPLFDLPQQAEVRAEMEKDFAEYKDDRTEGLIRPQKVLWDVREVMGPHDILL